MSLTEHHPPLERDDLSTPRGGDRFVAGALLAATVLLVAIQVLARHLIPPLAIFALVSGGLALATRRRAPRWLLGVDGVFAIVYLLGSAPFMAANLAHPESPVGFLSEVSVALVFLTVVVGAVTGLRGGGARVRRATLRVAAGILVVAVTVSLLAAAAVDSTAPQPGDVALTAERSVFPETVETSAGGSVLWIDNRDPFHHTFVVDGTDLHVDLVATNSVRVPIDLEPGTYRFWCDVPGHESMEGVLDVR